MPLKVQIEKFKMAYTPPWEKIDAEVASKKLQNFLRLVGVIYLYWEEKETLGWNISYATPESDR